MQQLLGHLDGQVALHKPARNGSGELLLEKKKGILVPHFLSVLALR